MKKLKLGLPKGSLQENTFELFKKAGFKIYAQERQYKPYCDDDEIDITLVRAQEIPKYVESGVFDCGITGYDWILETNAKVKQICELIYAKSGFRPVKWVVAVPEDSKINSILQLKNKRIATELVNYVKRYFKRKGIPVNVEFSWGATEVKVPDLVDAIVELTETGSSLRANKLKVIDEILVSTTRFIANNEAVKDKWKKEKIDTIALLLKGALEAEGMVGLKMNIEKKNLEKIEKILPSLKKPTVSQLSDKNWVAIEVVLKETEVKKIIPQLKKYGAQGIIEYPLNKVVY
ncbi:MAG: ATP phosphoribosyltransferase [Endomicrobia bacterium]|nr:ATP phosphoribosyltransferase [Endomicrobiia bacterium]